MIGFKTRTMKTTINPFVRSSIQLGAVLLLFAALLSFRSPAYGSERPDPVPPAPIRLQMTTFTPGLGQAPSIPYDLIAREPAGGEFGVYIVQFNGPIQPAWKTLLTTQGGEIRGYIPDFAYKVRMIPAQAARVKAFSAVAWVGLFHPAYKLSPGLKWEGTNLYTVLLEHNANQDNVQEKIETSGANLLSEVGRDWVISANMGQLVKIAHIPDVAWIENFALREKHNEYGAGVILGANTANASGYDGSTQIVAVADTGFGTGIASSGFADVPASRITAIYDWTVPDVAGCYDVIPDGAQDVDSGHGTHTAVSAVGGGDANGVGKGTAPAAGLVFQAVEDYVDFKAACSTNADGYYLIGLPNEIIPVRVG